MAINKDANIVIKVKDEASKKLKKIGGNLGTFSDKSVAKMKRIGEAAKKVAKGVAAIGAAVVAAGGFAIREFAAFEKGMSDVKAITKSTEAQMDKLEKQAKKLGRTTKFTALEAAEAQKFLGMAGFQTNEILEALPSTLQLAAAANLDLGRSADIASNILSQFGLESKDTSMLVDVLASTVTSSNTNMEELSEAMKFLGPTAAAFGVSVEEASATVGLLAGRGLKGSLATRALGTALTRLTKPTSEMKKVIGGLGLEVFNASGEFVGMAGMIEELERVTKGMTQQQKQATISTIFGGEAIQEINGLLADGSVRLREYTKELEDSEGAAAQMADTQEDNLVGSFTKLKSAMSGALIELGDVISEQTGLRAAMDGSSDAINGFTDGLVSGDFNPFLDSLGSVGDALRAVGEVAGTIWKFIADDLYPNVILPFFEALQVLAGLFVKFWKTDFGQQILKVARDVFGALKFIFATAWEAFKLVWKTSMLLFQGEWGQAWDLVSNHFKDAWEGLKDIFNSVWDSIKSSVKSGVDFIIKEIKRAMTSMVSLPGVSIATGIVEKIFANPTTQRANGGHVRKGVPVTVGEQGRETFVPDQGGNIIPNNKLGGNTINFAPTINISGDSDARRIAEEVMDLFRDEVQNLA